MCLAAIAINQHAEFPFVCVANRDEFHARPSAILAPWPEHQPTVYGGRDLQSGGTWLGINEEGRFALLTNVRNPQLNMPATAPSRGALVINAIENGNLPSAQESLAYAGFNLLAANLHTGELRYCTNQWLKLGQQNRPYLRNLGTGIHTLSNGELDAAWPKSLRLKLCFAEALEQAGALKDLANTLFDVLANQDQAEDEHLPKTGVPYDWEKMLSAIKIVSPVYGTRSSAVLVKHRSGVVSFFERTFDSTGAIQENTQLAFQLRF